MNHNPTAKGLIAAAAERRAASAPAHDLRRAMQAMAYAALIDTTLARKDATGQRSAAAALIADLEMADIARLGIDGQHMTLRMADIQAASTGGPTALLRNWQHNATARLQAGIRR